MKLKALQGLFVSIGVLCACGCGDEPPAPSSTQNEPIRQIAVADGHLTISQAGVEIGDVRPTAKLTVAGSFQMLDAQPKPVPVGVQAIANDNGQRIVANSASCTTEIDENGLARFSVEMAAPVYEGSYEIEVAYGEQTLAHGGLTVRKE